ncbi:MAG: ABC transporter ATP-binding protein, partial [Clostridiales bacterium]|nr:ABC transporter ATP-binding protein [Clostridiales bacterium]
MLEARHLYKTYKTKKGVTTKALDDVSVTFAEKGMVFILGKSGSGKSTLLNVCGGLDKMDRGEILIKGKSSADKGDFDFDSYRNTFVGFVFQEYNILEEFTVEENVALALELQHKKRDKEVIAKILADVDMTEFASRKPNTLSGGQKQRVAIARALVKNPEIIMADEPTGALDSNTGKQVFDTLKKLSQDKLVLIVSHDREFAEQYGDRIIELKDGKIISDMTREESEEADGKNVRFVGTDTVCVASGAELTDEDFANIKAFLSKSKGQAVITASRDKVDTITRDLRGGEFNETSEQPKVREYAADEKKMIRSRLPLRHAIKMGASSLKAKPVRLVFTIFLSIVAFLLFGVASTLMLYDSDQVTTNAFMESDYEYINFGKQYYSVTTHYRNDEVQSSYESKHNQTKFTMEEYEAWNRQYGGVIAVTSLSERYSNSSIRNMSVGQKVSKFYT